MSSTSTQNELTGCRILIAGAGGQVGIALKQTMPVGVELLALDSKGLNITDAKAVNEVVTEFKPDWIINAAAYTAVDKAESEPVIAFSVNRDGAANLAIAASNVGARMVQISTDYVFDGTQARPYKPGDPVNPINVYGESKLAGEVATREILGDNLLILRTAWVYASHGNNFLTTMLRLMQERDKLNIIEDQIGTPTSADSLAKFILFCIERDATGMHHYTDAGVASWYDFAMAIQLEASRIGLVKSKVRVSPICSCEYPTIAKRPSYSVLDKTSVWYELDFMPMYWQSELIGVLNRIDGK